MCWSNDCSVVSSLALPLVCDEMRSHAVEDISVCLCVLARLDSTAIVIRWLFKLGLVVESVRWIMDGLVLAANLALLPGRSVSVSSQCLLTVVRRLQVWLFEPCSCFCNCRVGRISVCT